MVAHVTGGWLRPCNRKHHPYYPTMVVGHCWFVDQNRNMPFKGGTYTSVCVFENGVYPRLWQCFQKTNDIIVNMMISHCRSPIFSQTEQNPHNQLITICSIDIPIYFVCSTKSPIDPSSVSHSILYIIYPISLCLLYSYTNENPYSYGPKYQL